MKKLILLCVVALSSVNSFAQLWDNSKPDKRVTFGVRAGANCSTWYLGYDDDGYFEAKAKWGLYGGVNVDFNIVKSFAIETGLFFSEKGCKGDNESWEWRYKEKQKYSYVQIPLFALYRLPLSEDFHMQVKAGGYIGLCYDHPGDRIYNRDVDAGPVFGLGLSYRKIYLGAQYELGLMELDGYFESKNRNLTISVGYDF